VAEKKARLKRGGAWLRAQRQNLGLTQIELAARIGIEQTKLSHYENGRYAIDAGMAARIAAALGASELTTWRGLEMPLPRDVGEEWTDPAAAERKIAAFEEAHPGTLDRIMARFEEYRSGKHAPMHQDGGQADGLDRSGDSDRTA
jgi:transcriptional regulator with XRE-family HTH domain